MGEPQLPEKECILELQENLTVEPISCNEKTNGSVTLYHSLCNYISLKGVFCGPHSNTTKVVFSVAHCFYVEQRWRVLFQRTSAATLVTHRHFKVSRDLLCWTTKQVFQLTRKQERYLSQILKEIQDWRQVFCASWAGHLYFIWKTRRAIMRLVSSQRTDASIFPTFLWQYAIKVFQRTDHHD